MNKKCLEMVGLLGPDAICWERQVVRMNEIDLLWAESENGKKMEDRKMGKGRADF